MRNFLFGMCAILFCLQSNAKGLKPEIITAYGEYNSKYILGSGLVSSPTPVGQGGITFSWKNGTYFDLWGSLPPTSRPDNQYGREVDVTAGWRGTLKNARVDVGLSHWNLYPVGKIDGSDFSIIFAEFSPKDSWKLSKDSSLTPYGRYELRDAPSRGVHMAPVYGGGLRHTVAITGPWSFNESISIFHQPSTSGFEAGLVGRYRGSVNYATNKSTSVDLHVERF